MIPNEVIEAAARALARRRWPTAMGVWDSFGQGMKDGFREQAHAALEAAAPYMLAGAWDEGASAQARCYGMEKDTGPNPYMLNNEGEK